MTDKYIWFFAQVEKHIKGFTQNLQEQIDAYKTSVQEHSDGLALLKDSGKCEHICKQFENIIAKHTHSLEETQERLAGAQASFKMVTDLKELGDESVPMERVVNILASILQLSPEGYEALEAELELGNEDEHQF